MFVVGDQVIETGASWIFGAWRGVFGSCTVCSGSALSQCSGPVALYAAWRLGMLIRHPLKAMIGYKSLPESDLDY